jgi:hypothetical protein
MAKRATGQALTPFCFLSDSRFAKRRNPIMSSLEHSAKSIF